MSNTTFRETGEKIATLELTEAQIVAVTRATVTSQAHGLSRSLDALGDDTDLKSVEHTVREFLLDAQKEVLKAERCIAALQVQVQHILCDTQESFEFGMGR